MVVGLVSCCQELDGGQRMGMQHACWDSLQAIDDPGRLLTRSRGWPAVRRVCIAHHFVEDGADPHLSLSLSKPRFACSLPAGTVRNTEYRI